MLAPAETGQSFRSMKIGAPMVPPTGTAGKAPPPPSDEKSPTESTATTTNSMLSPKSAEMPAVGAARYASTPSAMEAGGTTREPSDLNQVASTAGPQRTLPPPPWRLPHHREKGGLAPLPEDTAAATPGAPTAAAATSQAPRRPGEGCRQICPWTTKSDRHARRSAAGADGDAACAMGAAGCPAAKGGKTRGRKRPAAAVLVPAREGCATLERRPA